MTRALALLPLLLLAGCGGEAALPPERPDAGADQPSVVPVKLPKQLEFTGRWAVSPEMCATGWWDFGEKQIRTAGEMSCLIAEDDRTATTATLQLSCVGEGIPSMETWQLGGTPERMSVTRDKVGTVMLLKCPEV